MEVIIDVAACMSLGDSISSGSCEERPAAADGGMPQRVAAALQDAAAGDWLALESLLLGALEGA